ncbi:hypothetical protein DSL92_03285 [Billgrantia gudaonensis]|uniref:Uncharacterized protein n=1 Tax=Billgrantia gudaonensis TaxID=376427 RepID=A0A432JKN7_9GAMM|nr:hypothetical protein DSL92_03285 [Halomonas gudaonensis]
MVVTSAGNSREPSAEAPMALLNLAQVSRVVLALRVVAEIINQHQQVLTAKARLLANLSSAAIR